MLALPHGAADNGVNRPRAAGCDHRMAGQVRRQMRGDADRPHARAAAAVRDANVLCRFRWQTSAPIGRRAGQPDLRVHVRAVHVDLAAVLVDDARRCPGCFLEHAVRRRIGHHQRGSRSRCSSALARRSSTSMLPSAPCSPRRRPACRPSRRWPDWCRAPRPESARRRAARRRDRDGRRESPSARRTRPARRSSAAARRRRSR